MPSLAGIFAEELGVPIEAIGAGHRYYVGANPFRFKLIGYIERNFDLRACRN